MQHPVDGRAWKDFDTKYSDFAAEPRNVRLGLAADGFNPFGNLSQSYSMWPVILTTYNLPPWPLIDDLKDLWAKLGVETIDVATGLKFNMRAMQYLAPDVAKPLIELCLFSKPKGSIAEGYVAEEALTFSSYYFRDVTTKFIRPDHNVDFPPPTCQLQVFKSLCKSIGLRSVIHIDHQELKKVIWYVLHNSSEIDTYRAKFK
nr:hypothetical protein [Tanacetum cinerariifolium]